MKRFEIRVPYDRRKLRFIVEQLPSDRTYDHFKVITRNKIFSAKNNGPVIRRHRLKHWTPTWEIDIPGGDFLNASFKSDMVYALNKALGY